MVSWMDILILVSFLFIFIYFGIRYHFGYWKRKGVFTPQYSSVMRNFGKVLSGKMQFGVMVAEIYKEHKHRPYVGLYLLHSKAVMVNDLELVKTILVKEFQTFSGHGLGFDPKSDPTSNHLFNMEGTEWKNVRAKLTPTFTSSKMKYMYEVMLACSKSLENYLEEQVVLGKNVDFKDTLAKYGTDVIGSCAFGIEVSSFQYPDAEFRHLGKRIFDPNFIKSIKESMAFFVPSIVKFFKMRLIYKDVEDFLIKSISETIKYREENNITRNDFLQILIDMKREDEKNGDGKAFKLIEIVAQVYLFFGAGFETSSSTATYALYELAQNPEVQEKLRAEIDAVTAKHNGEITYESLSEMNYLTQTIEETLRMYPPLPFLFRRGNKDYQVPDTNIIIEKGTLVMIPLLGIQRDPRIHESPLEFNPDRFSSENKKNMHQFASIPFGEGPRICIGSRFGMLQTRLGIVSVLSKYKVSACEHTSIPMKFEAKSIVLSPQSNQYLKVTRRPNA